jgi:hypothetical protein
MVPGPYRSRKAHLQRKEDGGIAFNRQVIIYRLAVWLTLTMLDDPAMLAMAFC